MSDLEALRFYTAAQSPHVKVSTTITLLSCMFLSLSGLLLFLWLLLLFLYTRNTLYVIHLLSTNHPGYILHVTSPDQGKSVATPLPLHNPPAMNFRCGIKCQSRLYSPGRLAFPIPLSLPPNPTPSPSLMAHDTRYRKIKQVDYAVQFFRERRQRPCVEVSRG